MTRKNGSQDREVLEHLEVRRRKLMRQLEAQKVELAGQQDGTDFADEAFKQNIGSVGLELAEVASRELSSVETALEKISAGRYGKCDDCGRRIPKARLESIPHATRCLNCQREAEHNGSDVPMRRLLPCCLPDLGRDDEIIEHSAKK